MVGFIDVERLPVKEPRSGWQGRFFHSENLTLAYYTVKAGATIHEHSHSNDEVWNVVEGRLEITVAGETRVVSPGSAAVVPPNTRHSMGRHQRACDCRGSPTPRVDRRSVEL